MKKIAVFLVILVSSHYYAQTVGIIGTFNNWSSDVNMTTADTINWTLNYTFSANEQVKFRQNASWTVNWGSASFPSGVGVQDGADIPVSPGTYSITFNSSTGEYNFQADSIIPSPSNINPSNRQLVLQGFWWDYYNSAYPNGWANYLTELAPRLKSLGIDAVWIPPTIKNTGTNSVGYAPFDHYDLGDKWQKGSTKTRMGDKDEVLRMMAVFKANGIDVIQDVVLNHIVGAGSQTGNGGQDPQAMDDGETNKFKNFRYSCYATPGSNETTGNYLARQGRFPKNWQNFYPNPSNPCCTNELNTPYWGPDISFEGNAIGASSNATYNPSQTPDYMRNGMRNWIVWYKKQMGWDGLRLDAVKHFPPSVAEDLLWNLQNNASWASGTDQLFAVGEWVGGINEMDSWCNQVQNRSGTFDFSLRGNLWNIVAGNGNYDLATLPGSQQLNRQRTVPFVNNHDTFRPQLNSQGNYIGWNSALGTQVEPNDGRNSMAHAIALSLDGAPQIFFEDLFNIGYNGNRFTHDPKVDSTLPTRSDIENLIWCHQNLRFKEGAYLVRSQANDVLVIERQGKALIGVTDSWTQWQNINGVQTSWADGTILVDYSQANGSSQRVVYGGGKVDISIPPCDGTANLGRRGYAVWAPQGITDNYQRPSKNITQEWEMADDLGDKHLNSLEQGGALPDSSLDCRVVGKIYAKSGTQIKLDIFTVDTNSFVTCILVDKECLTIDSLTGTGSFTFIDTAAYDGWHTIKIRNASDTQPGQKCWVKATYRAPELVLTNEVKNKCACVAASIVEIEENDYTSLSIYPNPVKDLLNLEWDTQLVMNPQIDIYDLTGNLLLTKNVSSNLGVETINIAHLENGTFVLVFSSEFAKLNTKLFVKM